MPPSSELTTRWRLRDGVSLLGTPDGAYHLAHWPRSVSLGRLDDDALATLRAMAVDEGLISHHRVPDRHADLRWMLHRHGWGLRRVYDGERPLYSVTPAGPPATVPDRGVRPEESVLSRFAMIGRRDGRLVVESPRATHRITLETPALVTAVTDPGTAHLSTAGMAVADDAWSCGLLVGPDETERESLRVAQWQPHELTFHWNSRLRGDRLGDGFGATSWAHGVFPVPPPRRAPFCTERVPLPRPTATVLPPVGSLLDVMERRRSIREYDESRPLTIAQLGAFLHHCARVRQDGPVPGGRPYPSGGALYELEFYALVRKVAGFPAGLYHYDPEEHSLDRVPARPTVVEALLRGSATAMAGSAIPQVLLIMSARFDRLMWKYEAIGYALVLKHVGVLMQSMYLVATAMGLAPCALGTGDSGLFAQAIGVDETGESSVGEFALGSRPTTDGERA